MSDTSADCNQQTESTQQHLSLSRQALRPPEPRRVLQAGDTNHNVIRILLSNNPMNVGCPANRTASPGKCGSVRCGPPARGSPTLRRRCATSSNRCSSRRAPLPVEAHRSGPLHELGSSARGQLALIDGASRMGFARACSAGRAHRWAALGVPRSALSACRVPRACRMPRAELSLRMAAATARAAGCTSRMLVTTSL